MGGVFVGRAMTLFEKLGMGAKVDEDQMALSHLINQQEVASDVALSSPCPFAFKFMVQIFWR